MKRTSKSLSGDAKPQARLPDSTAIRIRNDESCSILCKTGNMMSRLSINICDALKLHALSIDYQIITLLNQNKQISIFLF